MEITTRIAKRVLKVVNAGLIRGLGSPTPGHMCVEAAVCYALGETHGDDPSCVQRAFRLFKIRANDHEVFLSTPTRTNALRRLAILQLGSKGKITDLQFFRLLAPVLLTHGILPMLRYWSTDPPNELPRWNATTAKAGLKILASSKSLKEKAKLLNAYTYKDNQPGHSYQLRMIGNNLNPRGVADLLEMSLDFFLDREENELRSVNLEGVKADQAATDLLERCVVALCKHKLPGKKFLKLTRKPLSVRQVLANDARRRKRPSTTR